ncbi:hypothetical protein MHIB_13310 [Mycolicibacter hiberniae]|uniref:Uncharacterized protein n=1 Tax=Mycolicibacter hiberniae TaxID=29314 RepID=A0A7I7X260_9MYCO|nr:hypothetical protein MHIB_13310 [Mycolicibacter hiberniae]
MTVAALVLGIIGTVLAAASLGWNVAQYLLSGARPKLRPIVGTDYGGSTVPFEATTDVRPNLGQLETQLDSDPRDRVLGVTVVNKGRADLVITRWSFRSEPSGAEFQPPADPGCPHLPCTVPPGGETTLFTKLDRVRFLVAAGEVVGGRRPQRVVATVTSGGRTRTSKPFFTLMLTEGQS